MDQRVFTAPLVGDEARRLPALLGRNLGGVDDAVLPGAPVWLLAGKVRALGAAVEVPFQAVRLFQGQVGQQPSLRVDSQSVHVGRMHT